MLIDSPGNIRRRAIAAPIKEATDAANRLSSRQRKGEEIAGRAGDAVHPFRELDADQTAEEAADDGLAGQPRGRIGETRRLTEGVLWPICGLVSCSFIL